MEETKIYIKKLAEVRASFDSDPQPSWVRITTITMTTKTSTVLNPKLFRENFKKLGGVIRIRNLNSKFSGFEWRMKDTTFYNQVTIGTQDHMSKKSVKLFPNGSIQVAGCSNLHDCERVTAQIALVIKIVLGLSELPVIDPPTIQMINTNFSLNCGVNLYKVIERFSRDSRFNVNFDPDKYSAVSYTHLRAHETG
jgi:hypothetical protein